MNNKQCEKRKAFSLQHLCRGSNKKPVEVYFFVDPLCPECWALEPIVKKLQIEYGEYFSLKHVLSAQLTSLNTLKKAKPEKMAQVWEKTGSRSGMSCDGSLWLENPISTPHAASIAIKSAWLQGKQHGIRFLRAMQETLFLEKQNVTDPDVLLELAAQVGLDVEEFKKDLFSESSAKAFQCDAKIMYEMDVDQSPTLVFFNENIEDEGVKVSGYYDYELFKNILFEMLKEVPDPSPLPPLEIFLEYYTFVATKEVAVVYDLSIEQAEKVLKKLQLQQRVEKVPVKHGTFWRYII